MLWAGPASISSCPQFGVGWGGVGRGWWTTSLNSWRCAQGMKLPPPNILLGQSFDLAALKLYPDPEWTAMQRCTCRGGALNGPAASGRGTGLRGKGGSALIEW